MKKNTKRPAKISQLQCILTVVSIAFYLASNIITGRQIQLPFGLSNTGALLIFPITYILSDVFSEVYGYKWSRKTNWISFAIQLAIVAIFSLVIVLPYPSFFTNADAYTAVLGNAPIVLAGSLLAFVFGDWANDKVFAKLKEKHPNSSKGFSIRAVLSSLAGEAVDSLIFFPIAFGLTGTPWGALPAMMATSTVMKVAYEILVLPITVLVVKKVKKYEEELEDGEKES